MADAGIYSVRELLKLEIKSSPLVESLLWERDNVFLVGGEKAGKSILAIQLAFALTSGQSFLGEYAVKKTSRVLYIQAEGKLGETRDRIEKMLMVNDCDIDNLHIAYFPHIALDTPEGYSLLNKYITDFNLKPEVVIFDPLYHCMAGSLIDEHAARKMTTHLRELGEKLSATIIVVHHTHKPIRSQNGNIIDEGDDGIFGSFVWKAWADHTLLFRVNKSTKVRVLSCNTQRSGKVVEQEELLLIDTPFLGFNRKLDESRPYELAVREVLHRAGTGGMTRDELKAKTQYSMASVEKTLRKLIQSGDAVRNHHNRPVRYWSKFSYPGDNQIQTDGVVIDEEDTLPAEPN